ncbi:MAG: molybdopterin-dependent oxidoreductase [Candidatus Thermoplasmatota archaeon]|nr:molybdopterin-dependent oxidoreductase [Candidatus Thermoplasmatota archaeon]
MTRRQFVKIAGLGAGAAIALGLVPEDFWDSLFQRDAKAFDAVSREERKYSTCWIGKQDCAVIARVVSGRIVKLEGHPGDPRIRGTLCPKGMAQIMSIYDPYRLKAPLKRTNPKGEPGTWVEITWDEALSTVADKIKEARAKGSKYLVWQKGRSKGAPFYDNAFVKASGAIMLHNGALCSDAGYRASEYTVGRNGVMHPDFKYCNYLLCWGWNLTNAGGNKSCWIQWNQLFVDARERGMKVVALDPSRQGVGPHADEWLPIKPGTDLAFYLALANVLIQRNNVDTEYLKKCTNAASLVKTDGTILTDGSGKEMVWDSLSGSALAYDTPGIDTALTGDYIAGSEAVRPAYQLFADHVADKTPAWAANICGLSEEQIIKVATDLGTNARIGSTLMIGGVEVPYRPVAIHAYHVTEQELGFQATRAAIHVMMLLGAIETAGGQFFDFSPTRAGEFDSWNAVSIMNTGYNISLKDSKYYPINSNNPNIVAAVMNDPARFNFPESDLPEVLIIHMTNPLLAYPSGQSDVAESYKKFRFIAVIDPWLSETADHFADIVLPAATIEKYEGPFSLSNTYVKATSIRQPPINPLYQSRGEIDIYLDLCEKAGILSGAGGYLDYLNSELKMVDPHKLDLNTKPTVRDVFDRWAKSNGIAGGITFFEKNGVKSEGAVSADKYYGSAFAPPYDGLRHRLYGEALYRYRGVMQSMSVDELYYRDYTAFPTWRTQTKDLSPPDYDLTLVSYKKIELKQSRTTSNALLNELVPKQRLLINSATATAKGIADGDPVFVESHNALTGETRKIQTVAQLVEFVRPDTVVLPHHYGQWVHPVARNSGPTPNTLFFTGNGYVSNTADQSFHVNVKVWKVA